MKKIKDEVYDILTPKVDNKSAVTPTETDDKLRELTDNIKDL